MSRGPRARLLVAAAGGALLIAGAGLAASALLPPAKAALGQILLERAWAVSEPGAPARPWPSADLGPAARLTVPALGVSTIVLGSASGEALAWGPGHVAGTAPLGGPGLAAIAGHRDSHLGFLGRLGPGALIRLETGTGSLSYRVTRAIVVDSRRWRLPIRHEGPSRLALSTCWPLDGGEGSEDAPHRLVIYADAIPAARL